MRKLMRWLAFLGVLGGLLGAAYAVFSLYFLDLYVDYWWFSALNYKGYFLERLLYRYLSFVGVFFAFFTICFVNFWLASRFLGKGEGNAKATEGEDPKRRRRLARLFRSGSLKIFMPLSLILAVPVAVPFYQQWENGLLFFFGAGSGIKDATFGRDISFFLFSFPVYQLIQNKLLIVFLCLLAALFLLYWIEKRLLAKNEQSLPRGARIHLTLIAVLTAAIQAWGFFLQRYNLVYTDAHEPLFYGPGFAEMWVDVPLIWAGLVLFVLTVMSLLIFLHRKKGLKKLLVLATLLGVVVWFRSSGLLQDNVEKYWVKPSQAAREKPYIKDHITGTLAAYQLGAIEVKSFPLKQSSAFLTDPDVKESLRNIPVWDPELLEDVYKQLQGIRSYYRFPSVDVDRYTVSGRYQQVNLAARELDIGQLPDHARNWVNNHLQYTHGYGLVMTPAAQGGDETMTWFMRDLPPTSEYGLTIKNPGIYYGLGKYPYSVVPNNIGEIDYPREEINVKGTYVGTGGVSLASMMRKFLFSFYFEDKNIFFTPDTVPDSRILFVRNIIDRIKKITPFLELDRDPYIVTTEEGVFWIQDAYTVSNRYPNAQPYEGRFNYIRNAVKIVVDAYHGTVSFYLADRKDPIAAAYGRIYRGLFKPLKEMPAGLLRHLRYPKDLFEIQMEMYARYHQTDPGTFFRQEDSWELCQLVRDGEPVKIPPYYLTTNLLSADRHEFSLVATMNPLGRNNLQALAIAGCDGDQYGKMILYSFPKGQQVYGPSQVDALIDQDTEIAQQLTLWNQAGSQVIRGRMIILPINGMILYIEPIYLSSATRLKIPELKRLVVSQGDIVAMASSLEEAFQKLDDKLSEKKRRKQERFQKVLPAPIEKTPPSRLGDDPDPAWDSPPSKDAKPPETAGDSAHV